MLVRIPLGRWLADEGVFSHQGLVAVRGLVPWSNGVYRPRAYFAFTPATQPDLEGQCYGMHVHSYGSVWEAYYAASVSGNVELQQVTLDAGNPATPDVGIASVTDRTGGMTTLFALGYRFTTFGKNVIVAGNDSTDDVEMRDSTGSSAFADMIPAGSTDRPRARYVAAAGNRVALAYITHGSTAERDRVSSSDTTNPNLVWVSGVDDPTYFSTATTPAGGTNDWDAAKLSTYTQLLDDLGDISGIIMADERFLVVFKERGIYRIDMNEGEIGVGVELLSREVGTRNPHSLVTAEGWVYFYGTDGKFRRINLGGELEDITKGSISSVLLATDWTDFGDFSSDEPAGTGNPSAAWVITPDVEAIAGTPGAYRYPVGAWCPHARTVQWVFPTDITSPGQRWAEVTYNVDVGAWAAADVTWAYGKPTDSLGDQFRCRFHWIAGQAGLGLRWKPSSTARWNAAPRDVFYAFESDPGTKYSITYPWANQDYGYLLLDQPQIRTPFVGIPGEDGFEILSRVTAWRLVYNRTPTAETEGIDLDVDVLVRSKRYPSQIPIEPRDMPRNYDFDGTGTKGPPRSSSGWSQIGGEAGTWHQLQIVFNADSFDADFPASATLVVNELQALELLLEEVTP